MAENIQNERNIHQLISDSNNKNLQKYQQYSKQELIDMVIRKDQQQKKEEQKSQKLQALKTGQQKGTRRYNKYSEECKLKAVELAKSTRLSNISIAEKLNKEFNYDNQITESNVRDFLKTKARNKNMNLEKKIGLSKDEQKNRKRRKIQSQKQGNYPNIEKKIYDDFLNQIEKKTIINFNWFVNKYRSYLLEDDTFKEQYQKNIENFKKENNLEILEKEQLTQLQENICKISKGLIRRMLKRLNITFRIPTNMVNKVQEDTSEIISQFILDIQTRIYQILQLKSKGRQYNEVLIINSDQTPIVFDFSNRTYALKGSKQVSVLKHNKHKERYTIWLAITNKGDKLKPFLIVKNKNKTAITNHFPNRISVHDNKKGWATQDMVDIFLQYRIFNYPLAQNQAIINLWYNYKCHTSQHTIDHFKKLSDQQQNHFETILVPPGCTPLVQPLDVSINKSFKNSVQKLLEEWWQETGSLKSNLTPSGYYAGPSHKVKQEIISKAWDTIDKDMIIKSFQYCGISDNLNNLHNVINKEEIKQKVIDQWEKCMKQIKKPLDDDHEAFEFKKQLEFSFKNSYYPNNIDDVDQDEQLSSTSSESIEDKTNFENNNLNKKRINNNKLQQQNQNLTQDSTQHLENMFKKKWLESSSDTEQQINKIQKKTKIQDKELQNQKPIASFFKVLSKEEKMEQIQKQHSLLQQQQEEKSLKEIQKANNLKLANKKKYDTEDEQEEEWNYQTSETQSEEGFIEFYDSSDEKDNYEDGQGAKRLYEKVLQLQGDKEEENSSQE